MIGRIIWASGVDYITFCGFGKWEIGALDKTPKEYIIVPLLRRHWKLVHISITKR
jgi:hypothetical protein